MLEHREVSGYVPKVEVVFTSDQESPFDLRKAGSEWQLSVNKMVFASKGFSPDEIEGAVTLEERRIGGQIAVNSPSVISGLRRWQEIGRNDPKTSSFKTACDSLATLASLEAGDSQKAAKARQYMEKMAARSAGSSYTDQLFNAVLQFGLGHDAAFDAQIVETVYNNLIRPENIEGREVSPLEALLSPDLSLAAKASWFEARFIPRLQFLEQQEKKMAALSPSDTDQAKMPPPTPSPSQDEYEQHRGREEKGKGSPIFVISPSYTGYWEEESYDMLNEQTGRSSKSEALRMKQRLSNIDQPVIPSSKRTISGNTGTAAFALPLAQGFQLTPEGVRNLNEQNIRVFADQEAHVFLLSDFDIKMDAEIALSAIPPSLGINSKHNEISGQVLQAEIEEALLRIRSRPIDSLGKLQEWKDFIAANYKYPQDEQVASMYASVDNSASRIEALATGKLLDCYLAREFFIAGLKRLNLSDIEWRAVNGHYVAQAQRDRTAQISSGTAHAWVKIKVPGEKHWIIFDPTPPGDPIRQGEGSADEFGKLSPDPISQENLQELEKEAKNAQEVQESLTPDQYILQFAREGNIAPQEAEQILSNLTTNVDKMKDNQGRNILSLLQEQFDRIINKYTQLALENAGPVEMSRGQGLDEPVTAFTDIRAGSLDPIGFERIRIVEQVQKYYGGWDLEIVADGSGSMNESLEGMAKYLVQRDMGYLLHRALNLFSQDAQRRRLRLVTPLKIRSSQYMFRGNKVEQIKPLSDEFTPLQMAALWKRSSENIDGGTPAHLGLARIFDTIPESDKQLLKEKKLLKVVAVISDGGYDDPERVAHLVAQLQELNVIVAEFHISDARSLETLPQDVALKVIEAAKSLMPERIKR